MKKFNGTAIQEIDEVGEIPTRGLRLIGAACDAALLRRGEDPTSARWSSGRFFNSMTAGRRRAVQRKGRR